MSFTSQEMEYLRSQRLARMATVSSVGQPDAAPVVFEFDGTYIYVGGIFNAKTRKYRNVVSGNTKVAFVLDDLVSEEPWTPRFLRIYGTADVVQREGLGGPAPFLRITPEISWSWNLDGQPFAHDREFSPRRTVHRPD